MTTFQELKRGECFRLLVNGKPSDEIFLVADFDIFLWDRVIRMSDKYGGGRAVVVSGLHAGQYNGHFSATDPVERICIDSTQPQPIDSEAEKRYNPIKVRADELREKLQDAHIYGQCIDWDNPDCALVAAYEAGYSNGISWHCDLIAGRDKVLESMRK